MKTIYADIVELDPHKLISRIQPRTDDWKPLDGEFIDSIRRWGGNLNPIIVWKDGDEYVIVEGHRRVAACRKLNLPVRAIVKIMGDAEAKIWALASNVARKQMSVPDIILTIKRLVEVEGVDTGELRDRLGIPRNTFYRYLRISKLDEVDIKNLGNGLTQDVAETLAKFRPEDRDWAKTYREGLWMVQYIYQMISEDGPILQKLRNHEYTSENIQYVFERMSKYWRLLCEEHIEGCTLHEKDEDCTCECPVCEAYEKYPNMATEEVPESPENTKPSGSCIICKSKLTDPDSIKLGMGPVCAKKGVQHADEVIREKAKEAYSYYESLGKYTGNEMNPENLCKFYNVNKGRTCVEAGRDEWSMCSFCCCGDSIHTCGKYDDASSPVPSGTTEESECECEGDVLCDLHSPESPIGMCSCGNEAEKKCPTCAFAVCGSPKCSLDLFSHVDSNLHTKIIDLEFIQNGFFVDTYGRKWRLIEE